MAHKPDVHITDELAAQLFDTARQNLGLLGFDPPDTDYSAARYAISKSNLPGPDKSTVSHRLCNACLGIDIEVLYTTEGYKHSDSLSSLLQSAKSCALCGLILKEMHASLQGSLSASLEEPIIPMSLVDLLKEFQSAMKEGDMSLSSQLPIFLRMDRSSHQQPPRYHSLAPSQDKWLNIGTKIMHQPTGRFMTGTVFGYLVLHAVDDDSQRPLLPRGSAKKTAARLLDWLGRRDYPSSGQGMAELDKPLPTRVLDLGEVKGAETSYTTSDLRLLETNGQHGSYIALSYCWGGYKEFRTLQSNYEERLNNISFAELPPVFSQAVSLARSLNIRYLWIDALCILQDDQDDWRREAAQMSEIYWNTTCRFAVTSCKSPLESFFPPRRITSSIPVPHIRYNHGSGDELAHSTLYVTLPKFYSDDVDLGHLNTRGWVLQERLLAPRTIHFTRDHIYCESEDDICGEDWVRRQFTWMSCIDKVSQRSQIDLFPQRSHSADELGFSWPKEEYHITHYSWLKIPELFSRCELTYPTDRLAALAGLIKKKQLHEYKGTKNLLGLWERDLHMELAWVASSGGSRFSGLKFLDSLGLPSWTWMAYEGPIVFVQDRRSMRDPKTVKTPPSLALELLDASVPDPMTPLPLSVPAVLTIKMTLREVDAVSSTIKSQLQTREDMTKRPFWLQPKAQTVPIALYELTQARELFDVNGNVIGYLSFETPTEDTLGLYCAEISILRDNDMTATPENDIAAGYKDCICSYALVLRKVSSTALGTESYCRVGLAQVDCLWMRGGQKRVIKLI